VIQKIFLKIPGTENSVKAKFTPSPLKKAEEECENIKLGLPDNNAFVSIVLLCSTLSSKSKYKLVACIPAH